MPSHSLWGNFKDVACQPVTYRQVKSSYVNVLTFYSASVAISLIECSDTEPNKLGYATINNTNNKSDEARQGKTKKHGEKKRREAMSSSFKVDVATSPPCAYL
uniref:Uncharacterized protein n=1 Tax=Timema poppense TaxID=170557 RepID=A0A7R9HBJ5_TIMPO|nr:unnamed protein product [Timema poppensis]